MIELFFVLGLDFESKTVLLEFSSTVTTQSVILIINDDDALETNETFKAVLELGDDDRVMLLPNETFISIVLDNDSKQN